MKTPTIAWSRMGSAPPPSVIANLMTAALRTPGMLSLAAGFTDNTVLPTEAVTAAATRLLSQEPDRAYLQYGTNPGREGLRAGLLAHLRSYPGECAANMVPDDCVITNGSQQALYISVQVLCDPGDIVFVESPSYFVFLELLRGLGVEPRGIPTTAEGEADPAAFAERLDEMRKTGELARVKLIYLMGYHANPSGSSIREETKRALGNVLNRLPRPLPVIEDGAYRDLYFESPHAAPSILSLREFADLPRLYAGTLTKPFATGLKVGYAVMPQTAWRERLLRIKAHQDFGTAHFNQAILENIVAEGTFHAFLQSVRPHYAAKMRALEDALRSEGLPEMGWQWESPGGGLLLWVRTPEKFDTRMGRAFHQKCLSEKVLYVPGDVCFAENAPANCLRLSTGNLPIKGIREGVRRLARAARAVFV
ncbi:MAG: PLP-dependent aminotransferase family protein [Opitutales bacterium]|nr:PLP-dependent aminotransferase family protein [Opitutales bacterium]